MFVEMQWQHASTKWEKNLFCFILKYTVSVIAAW